MKSWGLSGAVESLALTLRPLRVGEGTLEALAQGERGLSKPSPKGRGDSRSPRPRGKGTSKALAQGERGHPKPSLKEERGHPKPSLKEERGHPKSLPTGRGDARSRTSRPSAGGSPIMLRVFAGRDEGWGEESKPFCARSNSIIAQVGKTICLRTAPKGMYGVQRSAASSATKVTSRVTACCYVSSWSLQENRQRINEWGKRINE